MGAAMTPARLAEIRARQINSTPGPHICRCPEHEALRLHAHADIADLLAEVGRLRREAIPEFVARVNARAEADMLSGNPITGAHHRALEAELAAAKAALEGV